MGVWIEMELSVVLIGGSRSLPAWECGLKSYADNYYYVFQLVTPCVGVWIEMEMASKKKNGVRTSLPAWECGLKSIVMCLLMYKQMSLPAWECGLKLTIQRKLKLRNFRHSLRGSVD